MKDGISIVMAYHNRRDQLFRTINSINQSKYDKKKLEIIIVNDCSSEEHDIDDIPRIFTNINFTILNIKKKQKCWVNSCIPYNIGFSHIKYNKVLIQNPECYHKGDILVDINMNLSYNTYLSYACYSINYDQYIKNDYNNIDYLNNKPDYICNSGWYNHSIINPKYYHFANAIFTDKLYELNGFDERFKNGIGFDDDEFLYRIKKLGLNLKIIDNPLVLHQWHESIFHYSKISSEEEKKHKLTLFEMNKNILEENIKKEVFFNAKYNIYFNKINKTRIV